MTTKLQQDVSYVLLQDVLRNWNARLPAIVKTADSLVENAKNCIQAFNSGNQIIHC